jgi:hypothetical protein
MKSSSVAGSVSLDTNDVRIGCCVCLNGLRITQTEYSEESSRADFGSHLCLAGRQVHHINAHTDSLTCSCSSSHFPTATLRSSVHISS